MKNQGGYKIQFFNEDNANIICIAGPMILVNGYPTARNFVDFVHWIYNNKISLNRFKNWPFIGISSDIMTGLINANAHQTND